MYSQRVACLVDTMESLAVHLHDKPSFRSGLGTVSKRAWKIWVDFGGSRAGCGCFDIGLCSVRNKKKVTMLAFLFFVDTSKTVILRSVDAVGIVSLTAWQAAESTQPQGNLTCPLVTCSLLSC